MKINPFFKIIIPNLFHLIKIMVATKIKMYYKIALKKPSKIGSSIYYGIKLRKEKYIIKKC